MLKTRRLLPLLTTIVVMLLGSPVPAQILLKPMGESAQPLRIKRLDADATMDRQLAQTKLTLVFANETNGRVEADFVYTLPPNTLVTYFAYWFGDEKVVARVVEKERAAAIYKYITSRMRDPALIELIGKNTFRARIFPVMPGADLKVEMVLAQALPSTPEGALYTLPLRVDTKTDALEEAKVAVRVKKGGGIVKVNNNYGLPIAEDSEGYRLDFSGTNFRPAKDLRVGLVRRPQALQAALFAAPSSPGGDGFFALALTPNVTLSNPVARITGIRTYDVFADKPALLKAHQALLVVGRYRGSGPATVTLGALRQSVQFESQAEPNNVASKLWAARRIALLSAGRATNEATVVALSKRFTLPSKFTSWLAVPKAEMARYEREKNEAELSVAARQLAEAIREGRGESRQARLLRTRLEELCRKTGRRPEDALRSQFGQDYNTLGSELAREILAGRERGATARRLQAQFQRICRLIGYNPRQSLDAFLQQEASNELQTAADGLALEMLAEKPNAASVKRLRARLAVLGRHIRQDTSSLVRSFLDFHLGETALQLVQERRKPNPDAARVTALEGRLRRSERQSNRTMEQLVQSAEQRLALNELDQVGDQFEREFWNGRGEGEEARRLRARMEELARAAGNEGQRQLREFYSLSLGPPAQQLAEETAAGRGEGERAAALRRQYADLAREAGVDARQDLRQKWQWRLQDLAVQIAFEKRRGNPDESRIADAEQQLERLARALGYTPETFLAEAERVYDHGFEQTRSDLLEERRKPAPDPRRIAQLEARFRAQHDQSWRPNAFVDARLERLAIEVELDRLEKTQGPPAPEISSHRAELQKRWEELRARMGDPLIQVEAPEDALQVIALLPGGEIKRLVWNRDARRWEARFDIPGYTEEGTYRITVVIVGSDGARRTLVLRYHVDVTAPTGAGRVQTTAGAGNGALRLELDASEDTARVVALLPWGEPVPLGPSPDRPGRFFALVPVPAGREGQAPAVTFVLTDRAHNRTAITVGE